LKKRSKKLLVLFKTYVGNWQPRDFFTSLNGMKRACSKFADVNTYGVAAVGSTAEGSLEEASLAGASESHEEQGATAQSG